MRIPDPTSVEYERRAEEVAGMAAKLPPCLEREELFKISRKWREMADRARRREEHGI
jgi:hypothetical protein